MIRGIRLRKLEAGSRPKSRSLGILTRASTVPTCTLVQGRWAPTYQDRFRARSRLFAAMSASSSLTVVIRSVSKVTVSGTRLLEWVSHLRRAPPVLSSATRRLRTPRSA